MINTNKIKGRMAEFGITQKVMAKLKGLAAPTISQKLNNIRPMSLSEAEQIAKILNIAETEFGVYFFWNNVA